MNRGLYISATSMVSNQRKLDVLANNLANVNSTAYKKDLALTETFAEKLLTKVGDRPKPGLIGTRQIDYTGPEGSSPIHMATTERGYFVVETPMGKSYVKEIRFKIDDDGYLKTFYYDNRDHRDDERDLNSDFKTDYENYIVDGLGNRLQAGTGDVENTLQASLYYPKSPVIGTMNAGLKFQKLAINYTQGDLNQTGASLDLALKGPGFFKIRAGAGDISYSRDGSFTLNQEGIISTSSGHPLLNPDGEEIILEDVEGNQVSITPDGRVMVDGETVDYIHVVDLENREFLRKIGDNLYQMPANIEPDEIPFTGEILQGYLENSNVNAIEEMVEMISLLREFEAGQKAIRVQDEMLEKASNEIGRV